MITSREERIAKLIDVGWIAEPSQIPEEAIPVDPDLVNLGGSYDRPIYFIDQGFTCVDCGDDCVWKAEDQRWYFESSRAPFYQQGKRCRACRFRERERKQEARRRAGHDPSPD